MNETGKNGYITPANASFEDDNYPKDQGWVYLGNLGQPLQVMKAATNFTFENFQSKLQSLLPEDDSLRLKFENYTIYTQDKIGSVVDALNYLYPTGILEGEEFNFENSGYAELGLVTVGDVLNSDLIDFFGYDYNRKRAVTTVISTATEEGNIEENTTVNYGSWYYLGQIKVGSTNVGDSWSDGDDILLKKEKIYSIRTSAINLSNPMTSIKGGKTYTTIIKDPDVTSNANLFISMNNRQLTDVYNESTKRITINSVTGDIEIRKIS